MIRASLIENILAVHGGAAGESKQQPPIEQNTAAADAAPAAADAVADYCRRLGGTKVIRKILVANNGIGACKAIRSIRRWAYETFGNERTIQFVAMATPDDLRVNAEYIRLADEVVDVPGGTNNNNYANVPLIVDIAEQTGCDAVWPGWGHASENPRLPETLAETRTGVVFMGPNPRAMRDLGDKIGSTILAQTADVSCVAWSGTGVTVDYKTEGIPKDVYRTACVTTVEEALAVGERIGYPVMIKASEGGGGKGIRKVTSPEGVAAAFRAVLGEVPGSPVFIMRLCPNARHLEVQLLADQHGNAVALYGRDCSVQRRHQKILEEGPVTAAPPEVWLQMEKAAVRLAKLVNYCSAGTVEYLYDEAGRFYFLELNPRLQVEHPVTEWISGVNMPAAQLHVAMGIRLDRIPMIRRFYSEDPEGASPIDLDQCERRRPPHGHVIASRITAENPDEGFQPTSGQIQELNFRSSTSVWGYFSVSGRGGIHEYSDSQFGHLFAWGETRDVARKNLVCALKEISIHGDIRTPVEYLIKLLQMKNYAENQFHTQWLDGLIAEKVSAERPDTMTAVLCGALQRAHKQAGQRADEVREALARGQVPSRLLLGVTSAVELIYDDVKYVFSAQQTGPHCFRLMANKTAVEAEVRPLSDGGLLVLLDGKSHVVYAREEVGGLRLLLDGRTCQFPKEYDPSQLRSQMTGKLVRHLLEDGAHVGAGAPYAEIEVMKMYMPLVAPEAGRISYRKVEGSVLEAGDLIATLELDDPSRVRRAAEWRGALPPARPPRSTGDKPQQRMREALAGARAVMAGYEGRPEVLDELVGRLRDPRLPLFEFREVLSVIASRVPPALVAGAEAVLAAYEAELAAGEGAGRPELLRVGPLSDLLEATAAALPSKAERDALAAQAKPLAELCSAYAGGLPGREAAALGSLLREFIASELPFSSGKPDEDAIEALRDEFHADLGKAVDLLRSHAGLPRKLKLLAAAFEKMAAGPLEPYAAALHQLVAFAGRPYAEVALRARALLTAMANPTNDQRKQRLEEELRAAAASGPAGARAAGCLHIVKANYGIYDILVPMFAHPEPDVAGAALESFVRRTYVQYELEAVSLHNAEGKPSRVDFTFLFAGAAERKGHGRAPVRRRGALVLFRSFEQLEADLPATLAAYRASLQLEAPQAGNPPAVNVMDVAIVYDTPASPVPTEQFFVEHLARICKAHAAGLLAAGIKMVTFIVGRTAEYPAFYTFRENLGYGEDTILRHVLPAFSYELELKRLSNFTVTKCSTAERHIHLYYAEEKSTKPAAAAGAAGAGKPAAGGEEGSGPVDADRRFFVRAIASLFVGRTDAAVSIPEAEHVFLEGLKVTFRAQALEAAGCDARYKRTDQNHVFLEIRPDLPISGDTLLAIVRRMCGRYAARMVKSKVAGVEVRAAVQPHASTNTHLRVCASNPTGLVFCVDGYREQSPPALRAAVLILSPRGAALGRAGGRASSVLDPATGKTEYTPLCAEAGAGCLHPNEPYPVLTPMERKRIAAQQNGTSYVYDFPALFEKALADCWKANTEQRLRAAPARAAADAWRSYSFRKKSKVNARLMEATELVLGPDGALQETTRGPGKNDVGMVAWRMRLWTPEYPEEGGREIILIANDITHQSGSFSPKEDALFQKASELARREGLPRVYLAANSGARINLAAERTLENLREPWNLIEPYNSGARIHLAAEARPLPLGPEIDPRSAERERAIGGRHFPRPLPPSPSLSLFSFFFLQGHRYLYLTPADHERLKGKSVVCEPVTVVCEGGGSETRYRILDIIGAEDGLGVENLSGSGLIAGETSRAYEETFTLTFVTSRTVGIGAYLVRLGQRVIQKTGTGPIILTGFQALNKVLGREVYTSNLQIGGTKVMHTNGVSHLTVPDDLSGVAAILQWLSYVADRRGNPPPATEPLDPVARPISPSLTGSSGSAPTSSAALQAAHIQDRIQSLWRTDAEAALQGFLAALGPAASEDPRRWGPLADAVRAATGAPGFSVGRYPRHAASTSSFQPGSSCSSNLCDRDGEAGGYYLDPYN
eukprot:tig00000385_g24767.t1